MPALMALLWPVLVTSAEIEHKLEHGLDALLDLFQTSEAPKVLCEDRASYV